MATTLTELDDIDLELLDALEGVRTARGLSRELRISIPRLRGRLTTLHRLGLIESVENRAGVNYWRTTGAGLVEADRLREELS